MGKMTRTFWAMWVAVVAAVWTPATAEACWIDAVGGGCDQYWHDGAYGPIYTDFDDSSAYGCGSGYDGCDFTLVLDSLPAGQEVFVETYADALNWGDFDVFIDDGTCGAGASCVAAGVTSTSPERIRFTADGGTYWLTVDDWLGWCGDGFNLSIACPQACTPADVTQAITCSTDITGTTAGGSNAINAYGCGDPYPNTQQWGPEDIYTFTPQQTGSVTFQLSNLSNDQDLYVLEDLCDQSACIRSSNKESINTDSVTFNAVMGHTYYIVVEGFAGAGTYDLGFVDGTGGCREDCNDGADNDGDLDVDCDESDCVGDPACSEICTDNIDNDSDTLVDCDDPDCAGSPACCDNDGDGYNGCGGPDCNDNNNAVNPGVAEQPCNGIDDNCTAGIDENRVSADGDPVDQCTDCDDNDALNYQGNTEVCDGQDNDCDGSVDEGAPPATWYQDLDRDGYGTAANTQTGCTRPVGFAAQSGDCNDFDNQVFPGNPEVCDGKDNNCDTNVDEGVTSTWYPDLDFDNYGNTSQPVQACAAPALHVAVPGDCNDLENRSFPGNPEVCDGVDNNCNTQVDEGLDRTWYQDGDNDGYGNASVSTQACTRPAGYVTDNQDCNDAAAVVNPAAQEVCDFLDNDCDTLIDAADPSNAGNGTYFRDFDGDGYGNPADSLSGCGAPAGYVADDTDCNDNDASVHPNATEIPYDGIDQDCAGGDLTDVDGDGFDGGTTGPDCDDTDPAVNPNGVETPDGRDQDCDAVVDDGTIWFDDDGDGVTEAGGDCDDADPAVSPLATETCEGTDQDCDGVVDNDTACFDDDGDCACEASATTCAGSVNNGCTTVLATDCNDGDAAVNTAATEVLANGVDDDCDGVIDDGTNDPDGDGYLADGGDCGPGDANTYPGAPELEDGIDNDCDGVIDNGTAAFDDDGDGFSENDGDCNDQDPTVSPGAPEKGPDGIDNDCNGLIDDGGVWTDDDGDGWSEAQGDCDDDDAEVFPGAPERENGADDDCDGVADDGILDVDGDGFTVEDGDCNDHDGWVNPGLSELCDGIDNNCNGEADETCVDKGEVAQDLGACACTSAPGPSALALPLLVLGLVRRRRA